MAPAPCLSQIVYSAFGAPQHAFAEEAAGVQHEVDGCATVTARRGKISLPYTVLSPKV
jgi:hypothetical protein